MSSISPAPQGEVGQSHLSRHTGLGSEVRGEPSAADARGVHARHSTLQSVTATTTRTQTQPRMVQSSPSTPHEGVTGAAGRDFANQSVPIYGLDSRMPPSASSRDVTNSDAYATPAPLACAFGNPTTGTASGAPPTTTDGRTSQQLESQIQQRKQVTLEVVKQWVRVRGSAAGTCHAAVMNSMRVVGGDEAK